MSHPLQLPFFFSLVTVAVICLTALIWETHRGDLLHSHLLDPQNPGPHICSVRAPGKVREARRGFFYLPKQGHVSIPQLLGLLLPDGKRVRATLTLAELSCTAFLSWMEGFQLHQSISPLHSLIILSLSTSSLRSSTCSHHMQCCFHCPPVVTVGSDTPCSGRPGQLRVSWGAVWVSTLLPAMAFVSV